jgi:hypothetical protein
MNSKSGLSRRSCIYEWDQFQVERHAAASLDRDSNWKSNRKLICRIVDGLLSDVRHQREDEADMAAYSYALRRLGHRYSAGQGRSQHCKCNPCSSHSFEFSFSMFSMLGNAKSLSRSVLLRLVRLMPRLKRIKYEG